MSEAITPDQRVSAALHVNPDQVRAARDEWNVSQNAALIRATIADRIQRQIDERMNKLKTLDPANGIAKVQGEISALELALSLSTQCPLNNE